MSWNWKDYLKDAFYRMAAGRLRCFQIFELEEIGFERGDLDLADPWGSLCASCLRPLRDHKTFCEPRSIAVDIEDDDNPPPWGE